MKKIGLGRTGLKVHQLGLGGIPIQRVDQEQALKMIRHSVQCGVDFIDTSRAYTNSEGRIGQALKGIDKKVIPAALANNIGVIAMKPFSGGVIDQPELALKWVLSRHDVLVLGGVERIDYFDQNWKVFNGSHQLTPADKFAIADVAETYKAQAIKITGATRIALIGLKEEDIDNVWADLDLFLKKEAKTGERLGKTIDRVGFQALQLAVS